MLTAPKPAQDHTGLTAGALSCDDSLEILSEEMVARRRRGIVYGPVRSRRLGLSLGLNVTPYGEKTCPFNCVYCEVGAEQPHAAVEPESAFPDPVDVCASLDDVLRSGVEPETITFSGSGEPTLHPAFAEVVAGARRVRDRRCPTARIVVLSNGATADQPAVRRGLELADVRLMKLDSGDEAVFRAINRPPSALNLDAIVRSLSSLPGVTVQTILLDGPVSNVTEAAVKAYVERLREIHPLAVQLYAVSRATPVPNLHAVSGQVLDAVARRVREEVGVPVWTYGAHPQPN